jgi:hypothetical protein
MKFEAGRGSLISFITCVEWKCAQCQASAVNGKQVVLIKKYVYIKSSNELGKKV